MSIDKTLIFELETRFPSLGTDDGDVDMGDQWDALVDWYRALKGGDFEPVPAYCPSCGEFKGNRPCCNVDCDRYRGKVQRGAVSLPLAAAQAAIALGLVSGVASVVAWAQSLLGGVL